jgi:hypothetical protein
MLPNIVVPSLASPRLLIQPLISSSSYTYQCVSSSHLRKASTKEHLFTNPTPKKHESIHPSHKISTDAQPFIYNLNSCPRQTSQSTPTHATHILHYTQEKEQMTSSRCPRRPPVRPADHTPPRTNHFCVSAPIQRQAEGRLSAVAAAAHAHAYAQAQIPWVVRLGSVGLDEVVWTA